LVTVTPVLLVEVSVVVKPKLSDPSGLVRVAVQLPLILLLLLFPELVPQPAMTRPSPRTNAITARFTKSTSLACRMQERGEIAALG
jgi:hypothetical protein